MADAAVDDLLRYERGWTNAMGDYWRERMERLRTIDTGRLYASIKAHLEQGSVTTIEHNFLQYDIYVAAGVGPAHEWYKWTEAQGGEKVHRLNNGDLNGLTPWATTGESAWSGFVPSIPAASTLPSRRTWSRAL